MLHKGFRVCLLVLLTAIVTDGELIDYKYYPKVPGWFKLHLKPTSWANARLQCDLEGAVLASPLNAKLLEAMKEVMADQIHGEIFTGMQSVSIGNYFSVEGVPLSKIPVGWAPNEPDIFEDGEHCIKMFANETIANIKCTEELSYICYKKDECLVKNSNGNPDSEYHLDSRTGSCYKFHSIGQNWSQAYTTCAYDGGYLTIINSEVESQVLVELFSKFPSEVITAEYPESLFIGFQDWSEHKTWRTVHGETLQAAGFDKWAPGEPNNAGNNEYCGNLFRTGLLNDAPCNMRLAFICEKSTIISKCSNSDAH